MGCLNRLSSVLCDPKLCPCGELCSNRSLHLLRPPRTEVFLTENRGWGVRAAEPVQKVRQPGAYAAYYRTRSKLGWETRALAMRPCVRLYQYIGT